MTPRDGDGRRIDAVLFDCDGVLVDSERVAAECIIEFAARFGAVFEFDEALVRFTGARMADNLRDIEARGKCTLPDDFEDSLRAHMAAQFEARLEPMDGAGALIEALDVPYCVASNGPRSKMEVTLRIAGLLEHFDGRIVSAYEVGVWKPDPGSSCTRRACWGWRPSGARWSRTATTASRPGWRPACRSSRWCPGERAGSMPDGVVAVTSLADLHAPFTRRASVPC